MRRWIVVGAGAVLSLVAVALLVRLDRPLRPAEPPLAPRAIQDYVGVYQWDPHAFVYLQPWNELTGTTELVAVDDSGEVRTLYPTGHDRFVTGAGAAVREPVEARIQFHRKDGDEITSLTWHRRGASPRVARRVDVERWAPVRFANGDVQLAGTLIVPSTGTRHPAVILVHGSGPQTREGMLPFARFLVRRGMAVLSYDKRGVGGSTGRWQTASFEDLAGDVVAAFDYLRARPEIDASQIGLLGISQAGWVMPIAAARLEQLAFLISLSGPGVPPAQTTIDHAREEMKASGLPRAAIDQVVALLQLQYRFARTGDGWDEYKRRQRLARWLGASPDTFPGSPDHPQWGVIRRLYFYDPAPALRRLRVPVLALFAALDNNVLPGKNKAAWETVLRAAGHGDYTLHVVPRANHLMLEARVGNNAEMSSLSRFVPEYFEIVEDWLAARIPTFRGAGHSARP